MKQNYNFDEDITEEILETSKHLFLNLRKCKFLNS